MIRLGGTRIGILLGAAVLLIAACGKPDDPINPGGDVNADPNAVFAKLMQRSDIDQAAQQYQQMATEIQNALTAEISELSKWTTSGQQLKSACGNDNPGLGADGEERDLVNYVSSSLMSDEHYESALRIVGSVAQKYGFNPQPQRMHDAPRSHDAFFHNSSDGSAIQFGTDKATLIGISIGCHLTAEAKKRGSLGSTTSK